MADIEERIKNHSSAFEGLLSLIPGNKYFEADNSKQWSKRKQSKEEHKRAKKAKLDPDSATTAAEFRAKRQRGDANGEQQNAEEEEEERAQSGSEKEEEVAAPKPKKAKKEKKPKTMPKKPTAAVKQEGENNTPTKSPAQKKGKGKASDATAVAPPSEDANSVSATATKPAAASSSNDGEDEDMADASEPIQINGFSDLVSQPGSSTTDTPVPAPPTTTKRPKPVLDPAARAEQRARLAARIEALRAKRKADNADASSARTRQDLLEARRKKEALRKERKKAIRMAAKLEEGAAETPETTLATTTSNKTVAPAVVKDFSFGRIAFDDGRQLDAKLQDFQKEKKKKGPTDLLGQLKHTEAKKRRIEQMSEEKKEVVLEKEKWSKALKLASGEKVRDDEKLLKKALKRQEIQKRKSSHEWGERLAGVAKSQAARIKKREENIQARKDQNKAAKHGGKKVFKKKGGKPSGKKGGNKKTSRPGFEGGMKAGGKGKGKK